MKGSSWNIQVGLKSNNKCLYKRKAEGDLRQKRRRDYDHGGRAWSDSLIHKSINADSYQNLEEARNGMQSG